SQKAHIRPNRHLGQLVSHLRALEPQLSAALRMNPELRKLQGEAPTRPPPPQTAPGKSDFPGLP
ncbi:Ret Finger Protein-Like 3, partial [Manis pentadactyla]